MKNNKGFTLMELLLSISVLALIMLIAIPSYLGISNAIRKNQRKNLISKIEDAASKYAFDTGETLIFVDELVTEGYIDSDDEEGNIIDPVNHSRLNCYVVEMTKENSYYKAEFKNDKNFDVDGVCDYNKLEESSSNVSILATGEKISDWYKGKVTLTATSDKMVIDCTKNTCKWTSSSGLDKNGESLEVDSKGILSTKYTFQYTIYNEEDNTVTRYKDVMNLKIDNESPVIYSEQIVVSDRYVVTENKTVSIVASDGRGSGISGYALSKDVSVCSASELEYQESNTFTVEDVGTYKVCVKDKVNNYSEYNLEIKYINPKYTVKVSSNNESYGTVSPGSQTVSSGGTLTFTISPKSGYKYSINNCGGTVSGNTLTISNVTSDVSCTVYFNTKSTRYSVSVSSNNTSYGTVSPNVQSVSPGETATITLKPKSGYEYSSNDCGGIVEDNILTISNINESINCTVTFKAKEVIKYSVHLNIYNSAGSLQYNDEVSVSQGWTGHILVPCSVLNFDNFSSVSCSGECEAEIIRENFICDWSSSGAVTIKNVISSCTCDIYLK